MRSGDLLNSGGSGWQNGFTILNACGAANVATTYVHSYGEDEAIISTAGPAIKHAGRMCTTRGCRRDAGAVLLLIAALAGGQYLGNTLNFSLFPEDHPHQVELADNHFRLFNSPNRSQTVPRMIGTSAAVASASLY